MWTFTTLLELMIMFHWLQIIVSIEVELHSSKIQIDRSVEEGFDPIYGGFLLKNIRIWLVVHLFISSQGWQ